MNHALWKETCAVALESFGLHHVFRFVNRHKAAILLYHSVVRDEERAVPPWAIRESKFRWQMEYLTRHYRVLPLPDYIDRLLSDRPIPEHSVVITFDDGFRDNYTIAYPILKKLRLPATIFLVTGYLDSDQPLWPDVLFQALVQTKDEVLDIRDLGDGYHPLTTLSERRVAFYSLVEYLKTLPVEEKNRQLEEIARRLNLNMNQYSRPEEAPFALLRRHEIQQMAQEGLITFGVHTETHEILTRFPFERAQQEIRISKQKVEALLKEPVRFFAYPNGTQADFNEALKREVRQLGFACAFASCGGLVNSHFDPYALTRLGIGGETSPAYFKLKLAGGVDVLDQFKSLLGESERL